ncbi:DUF3365 domain-containing protein [Pseudomonadota bacterium]
MKSSVCALLFGALLPTGVLSDQSSEEMERAQNAIALFAQSLKTELVAAMQSGGPVNAIDVCHSRADMIAEEISRDRGMQLSRVSTRNRNPENAAEDWQLAVLETFGERQQAGESVKTLTWSETAETSTGLEFRFMKAIPTGGLCLNCHGTELSPEVASKLAELYPQDRAVGYRTGEIRGAFVVTSQPD